MQKDQILYAANELRVSVLMAARKYLGTTDISPKEVQEKKRVFSIFHFHEDKRDIIEHLLYMTEKTQDFVAEERVDKAMRWLSFVQGSLWILGALSIHQGQEQNRQH